MSEAAIVYLARARSGLESLQRFLRSYERHPGGLEHDLVVVFKGFSQEAELAEWRTALTRFPHQELRMSDFGFDIRAYSLAARRLPHRYLCFLNSFSEPLTPDWLRILHRWVVEPGVGVVGCTGAWTSISSIVEQELASAATQPLLRRLLLRIKVPINRRAYPPFPNPHLRSNAFLVSRELMTRVWPGFVIGKRKAYHWESGRKGFTRRVQALNLRVLVAGKDGRSYTIEEWPRSGIFLQGKQENLLVSDNQTRGYDNADAAKRRQLSMYAWGMDRTSAREELPAEK
ncbi:MAG TPA: hypothetical protein VIL39_06470 [Verrucomicrobiae bacterium]